MFLRSSACDQNRQKLHFITVKKSDNVPADRCSSSFKTFFFSFFFFLSVHFVFCKRTQNVLSVALRWWTECDFCTEQLLEGLTNTAKWNAINLAYSTIAACLLCKGLYQSWLGIGEFFCPVFWRNERHRYHTDPLQINSLSSYLAISVVPNPIFIQYCIWLADAKLLPLTFLPEMMSSRKFCMFNFLSQYCRYNSDHYRQHEAYWFIQRGRY